MFARRINENKIGNSVRDEIMSCVAVDGYSDNEKMSQGCIDIIMKYDCEDYDHIESSDFVEDMLERLKMHDKIQYIIIKKHCIEGMTQKDLGIILNLRLEEVIAITVICALIELISNLFDDNDKHKPRMV